MTAGTVAPWESTPLGGHGVPTLGGDGWTRAVDVDPESAGNPRRARALGIR